MSATAEVAIHAGSLAELPTDRVLGVYSYATRKLHTTPWGHADEGYYVRMRERSIEELQRREDAIAKAWRDSFV
jgi:hypothetical protein